MILTGKAKENFYKFLIKKFPLNENEVEKWFISLYNEFKNALIIEWFDSIKYDEIWSLWDFSFKKIFHSNNNLSIIQIQEKAIKKANEYYNL